MAGRNDDSFKSGDLVFAKMKGFPHWPARVCKSEDGYKKRVPVYFFGTHQIGYVTPENVVPYAGNKSKYGSGVRIRGFAEGMWEIQNSPGLGSKLKVPGKTNTNVTPAKPPPVLEATPSKLASPTKTPHDKLKGVSPPGKSEPDSKPAAGRSTPSKGPGETGSAVRTSTRSSTRSGLDKSTESKQIRETEDRAPATRSRRSASGGLSAERSARDRTSPAEVKMEVWDMRKGTSVMDMKHHEDYISDITVDQAKRILLTASGDGTMGVFNIKRRRFELLSEYQTGDLTSVALMKRGKKVVCGSSEGTVYIFNWNGFGATSDRFALKAESVDCMAPITDSIMCTASTDGYIRAINLLPNRVIGCIGQHVGEPVEEINKSWDSRFLVSCAHDQLVKFWDITSLPKMTVDEHRKRKKRDGRMKSLTKKALGDNDFFSGLVEETVKEEEEEQEEEEEEEDSGSE